MPKNKNAIIRYQILDELLSDRRHYYTRRDLYEKCNKALEEKGYPQVSKRTIELDLNDIDADFQDIEIDRLKKDGKDVVRYSDPSQSIFRKKLSNEETLLLADILDSLGEFSGLENFGQIEALQAKFHSLAGDVLHKRTPAIVFSENPYLNNGSISQVKNTLAGLFSAIINSVTVRIEYQKFNTVEPRTFDVFPYQLRQYNDRWYLICQLTEADRKFLISLSLDRIKAFQERPEISFQECFCNIDEYYEDVIGITRPIDATTEKILFAVSQRKLPYIETKPLHESQARLPEDTQQTLRERYPALADYVFFRIECIPNNELKETFFSFDKDLVLLHDGLKQEICTEMERQLKLYSSLE